MSKPEYRKMMVQMKHNLRFLALAVYTYSEVGFFCSQGHISSENAENVAFMKFAFVMVVIFFIVIQEF